METFIDLCESTKCETWQKCVFDGRKGPICVCRDDLDCPAEFKPVCGSDAKRYNNECIMKATACREGKSVKKAADGFCTPGMSIFVLEVNTSTSGTVLHLYPSWELNCLTYLNRKMENYCVLYSGLEVQWVRNETNYAKRTPLQKCYGNTVMLM